MARIIDMGSHSLKLGIAGDDTPIATIPTVMDQWMFGQNWIENGVGDGIHPIQHGIVTNWDDMIRLWIHVDTIPEWGDNRSYDIVLTESALNPAQDREKLCEIWFEELNAERFGLWRSGVLALNATGRTTGLVIDSGGTSTYALPVFEGNCRDGILLSDLGGQDLSNHLVKSLAERGYENPGRDVIRDIKHNHCYVSQNFAEELNNSNTGNTQSSFELPDGEVIQLDSERFAVPEALFDPSLLGKEAQGIHEMIYNSINACDAKIQDDLRKNVVVVGGNTLFGGLESRLEQELARLGPGANIVAADDRPNTTFLGASILYSMSCFDGTWKWMTDDDYNEHGSSFVHRKFPIS